MEYRLSERWIKASIIGTIWASSEIVLGSFLHNLKVPFSGNILTAIGIIILISISYTWTEKGLFWRSGLICALMKTMSPSAVIFGPMIAILTEAAILEILVRLLGRTIAGYVIGSMLAMSWNLMQKILNYIIFYGSNIIDVYSNLLKIAQKQLNIQTNIVWIPVIILLVLYALFGLLAAIVGIRVGRKMLRQPDRELPVKINEPLGVPTSKSGQEFNYSIGWLFLNLALIICSFILMNRTILAVWSIAITGIVIVWTIRYKSALRQLLKPKFWLLFVFITLITAFVFTESQPGENSILKGLLIGIQMNFRAVVIILGFSVLGTELFNPFIRTFFLKTSFKNLPLALELSAESLPLFIANIPDFKTLLRNPVSVFYQVLSHAEGRLSALKGKSASSRKIFIIAGSVGEGKTTYAKKLIEIFKKNNIKAGGILSERVMTDSKATGYDLINIETGEKEVFLRQHEECGSERIGRFTICPKGLAFGNSILKSLVLSPNTFVVIDEIGLLEVSNKGWSDCLNDLLENSRNTILLIVRDTSMPEVKNRWNLKDAIIFNINEIDYQNAGFYIIENMNFKSAN
jgi:nucleoside-triphosphatase THEP1